MFDKAYVNKGPLGAPKSLSGQVVKNAIGSLEFTLPADHPRIPALTASGARVLANYRPPGRDEQFLISGAVEQVDGGGPRHSPWRKFAVEDDFSVLTGEVQCWPNPTGTIAQQGDDEAYFTVTGPAETVLKAILAPNVTRQGTVLTIPATAGLGATITGSVRFHTAFERLFPAVEQAGLGVRVRQAGASRILEVYVPETYDRELTQESGIVVSGEYSVSRPTITRVTALAGGEGTARVVRQKIDAAREAEWGVVMAATRDARDVASDDPNLEALLLARMDETLAEGASKASLKCELTETESFRYGVTFALGDKVTIRLADAPPITDYVRSVDFSWSKDDGVRITPRVGEWSDVSNDPLIERVVELTRAVSNLEKR
ncbi:Gp37-like protein [Oerskovia enterophila]|uniref:Gp37-like protein n=1 Tax=Oerskovia enterophila TaxID=43678 RepID=UPI00381F1F85